MEPSKHELAVRADRSRFKYPDGTRTTKEERRHFEQHLKLPRQTRFTWADGSVHDKREK